jgi:cytochrome c oxidase subunit 3
MGVADEETGEEHGHHLPAVEDWPRGFGEASWWPFVTALGVTGIYAGAALFVLGRGSQPLVPPFVGPVTLVGSTFVFLAGLYGWLYHAFVVEFWRLDGHGSGKLRWGMSLFLVTEVATFGAGFVYYFFVRAGAWPPEGAELPHLLSSLILVNTAILVASSVTLHWAHVKLHRGDHGGFVRWLVLTLALGVVFIGGQALEYWEFVINEGFTLTSGIYASAFFGLTGLHGLHVSMGVVLLAVLLVRALAGQYDAERDASVSTVSMYWHFVDAVWLFLVAVIYVGAASSFQF